MIKFVVVIGVDDFHGLKRDALWTILLHDEEQNVLIDLEPFNQSWKKYGCNIVSNGWNDLKKRSTIKVLVYSYKNVMQCTFLNLLVNPWLWNTFMSISKMSLRQWDLRVLCKWSWTMFLMVGPQVIWERIKDTSIVWTPWSTHNLDLIIKNITKLFWVKDVVSKANHVENFVTNKPKTFGYLQDIPWFGTFEVFQN